MTAYTSPTWVDVPPGTVPPAGAPALKAANLQPLTDAAAAALQRLTTSAWTTGSLAIGVNTVDASGGAKTPTLPTPTATGQLLSVEKTDSSANTVTISGTIRGGAGTLVLSSQFQDVLFVAESLTSWRPLADHRTAASLSATFVPATHFAEGKSIWIYGDSGALVPGLKSTQGQEWPVLLRRALQTGPFTSYAIGGTDVIGAAMHLIGVGAGGSGLPAFVSGAKWDGTRRGIAILHTGLNDAAGYVDRTASGPPPVATDTAHQNGMTGALRAAIATLSSASRVEVEAGTLTGAWSTNTDVSTSGGSRYTTTPGDNAAVSVTFPASGKVHLIAHACAPEFFTPAAIQIAVDGTVVKSVASSALSMRRQKTVSTPTYVQFSPYAIEVDAVAGAHTVTLTHAGSSGQIMSLDCFMVGAASPPAVFVPGEWSPVAGSVWSSGQIATLVANRAALDPLYKAVVAEFPNASYVPLSRMTATGLGNDGLHPNDRGHRQEAETWALAIEQFLATYDPDNLYTSLSTSTTPASLVTSGTWGTASGTAYTAQTDSMFYITGGTVTAIAVDGTATGLTAGSFYLRAGHTIKLTYSAAPTFTQFDVS